MASLAFLSFIVTIAYWLRGSGLRFKAVSISWRPPLTMTKLCSAGGGMREAAEAIKEIMYFLEAVCSDQHNLEG